MSRHLYILLFLLALLPGNISAQNDEQENLLEQADVVTLHVPGGKSTENIMNAETIARMRRGEWPMATADDVMQGLDWTLRQRISANFSNRY